MSASTPADLAVTFRSLARRQREAIGDADPGAVSGLVGALEGHVAAAAALLHTTPDAEAVARAIEDRPADEWDEATLDALRAEGLAAGGVLRSMQAAVGEDDDD
jgi:hypothetical protein